MREWNASLRIHFDVAKTAVDNAESKAIEAKILLDSGHPAPAAALAVIGQEETEKALLHTLIWFGLVPEDAISEAIKLTRDHGRKQQLAMVGHLLADIASKIRPFVDAKGICRAAR
jgi:AbiV family abortive infection protein